jgi:hypothetical protein
MRNVEFGTGADYKYTYTHNTYDQSTITNMAIMQNFHIISSKFNVHKMCTYG